MRNPSRAAALPCALSVAVLLAGAAGCGYAPVRQARGPVTVPAVKNDTAQIEVGGWIQGELRKELAARGRLGDEGAALEVELVSIRAYPSATNASGAAAWRIDAEVHARAANFDDSALGSEDYLAAVDVPGTEANRRAALRRLARSLARELIERFEVSERMAQ